MSLSARRNGSPDLATDDSSSAIGRLLVAAALLVGGLWMAPLISAGPLALDEHGSFWIADADGLAELFHRSQGVTALPPLSAIVQRCFLALSGSSELALRAASAVPFLAAILLTYLLGRRLLGDVGGGMAALLLASYPDVLDEVRLGRAYGLVVFFAALSGWLAVRWMQSGRWSDALGWSASAVGLLWTHYLAAPFVAAQMLAMLLLPWAGPPVLAIRQKTVAVLLTAIGVFPLAPALVRNWEWRAYLDYRADPETVGQMLTPFWWAGVPAALLLVVICRRILNRPDQKQARPRSEGSAAADRPASPGSRRLLLIWWGVPMGLSIIATLTLLPTLSNARYRAALAVPGACLAAWLLTQPRRIGISLAAASVALAVGWGLEPLPPWTLGRVGHPADTEWRNMAWLLNDQLRDGEPIFVQSGLAESNLLIVFFDNPLLSEYAACRVGQFYLPRPNPRYGLPSQWRMARETADYYDGLLRTIAADEKARLWVAGATDTDINRDSLAGFERLLERRGFTAVDVVEGPNTVLKRFERHSPAP